MADGVEMMVKVEWMFEFYVACHIHFPGVLRIPFCIVLADQTMLYYYQLLLFSTGQAGHQVSGAITEI